MSVTVNTIVGGLIISLGFTLSLYIAARAVIRSYFKQKQSNLRSMLNTITEKENHHDAK